MWTRGAGHPTRRPDAVVEHDGRNRQTTWSCGFYVVVAVVFAVSVGLGVAGAKDAIDKQPVVWGTFTQERCEPATVGTHRNCRSLGDSVSDDGSIVKKGIYLDGWASTTTVTGSV